MSRAVLLAAFFTLLVSPFVVFPALADPAGIRARDVETGVERPRDLVEEQRLHEIGRRLKRDAGRVRFVDDDEATPSEAGRPPADGSSRRLPSSR